MVKIKEMKTRMHHLGVRDKMYKKEEDLSPDHTLNCPLKLSTFAIKLLKGGIPRALRSNQFTTQAAATT